MVQLVPLDLLQDVSLLPRSFTDRSHCIESACLRDMHFTPAVT